MSRYLIAFAICALLVTPAVFAQAAAPGAGVFYSSGAGWAKMPEAPTPQLRTQGETSFFFDVVNNLDAFYEYPGTTSPVQLSDHKPVFRANLGYVLSRDLEHIEIIALKQKNNRREARLTWSSGDMVARYPKSIAVSLAQSSDGVVTITPQTDLASGEYLLSFGHVMLKYDFSVR
jgi:hypothetical protein